MEKLKPKLFSVMKTYTKQQFVKDVISGIIVAIIALPLSIALAIASGVSPDKGIYTAIVAGFIVSFLGGSRVQIAGPTAAFATIVAGIATTKGMNALIVATIMAGVIMILMGLLRLGGLIKYIPYTITTGFTAGIAITILVGQIKDFLGLSYAEGTPNIETIDKVKNVFHYILDTNPWALLVGGVSLLILIVWPYINKLLPASLIAVLVGSAMVAIFDLDVYTIGTQFKDLKGGLPTVKFPVFSFTLVRDMLPDAFTIAILASIESLLSCVVADSMVNSKHRSNMELIAQGAGNIASVCLGGIPATGAIARTAANIKNGGRTPIAGMVHSIVLVLVMLFLMPYAKLIPMPTIAAILFVVAYNMSGWRKCVKIVKSAPKSDIIVFVVTFVLTVIFDLVVAIEVGILLAAVLFMKRMSDVTEVEGWKYADDENDPDALSLKVVPKHTVVYELSGPLFFAVADKIMTISLKETDKCLVLRMRSVNAIDITAMNTLEELYRECKKKGIVIVMSHVNEQPMNVMKKAGFCELIGEENFCPHIDVALARAQEICEKEV